MGFLGICFTGFHASPCPLPQHCSKSSNQQHFRWEPGETSCDRTVSPRKEAVGAPRTQSPASREPRLCKLLPIPSSALAMPRLSGRGHQANGMSKQIFRFARLASDVVGKTEKHPNLYALNMANPSSHRYNDCCLVCGHKCHPSHFVGGQGWGSGCNCKIVMAVICRSDCDQLGSHKWASGAQRFNSGSDGVRSP